MIVPMKKVSLIIKGDQKESALKKLRRMGFVHIEIEEGSGEKLSLLREQIQDLERALFILSGKKNPEQIELSVEDTLSVAKQVVALDEEKKQCQAESIPLNSELDRVKSWGNIDPISICDLESKGYRISFYEMPRNEYKALEEDIVTVKLDETKGTVKLMLLESITNDGKEKVLLPSAYQFVLPTISTDEIKKRLFELKTRIDAIDEIFTTNVCYVESIKKAINAIEKEVEFETYVTGMMEENLSPESKNPISVACFKGFVEEENLDKLKEVAENNKWGLLVEDPREEDNVPTKLKNNRFVSLVYPLTDFLGTVPGYFEYDISGWFLAFILLFFGIIFGDGGYGLFICAVASIPIIKAIVAKKKISPLFLLVELFGLSTILWGTLTCTWFGLSPTQLPEWLRNLSIPLISNVYADKIWYPFWTNGKFGLTTTQNVQIFCFTLALIQLSVAHIKGAKRNKNSLKKIGDIGSILQLLGIYYLVLNLVVNNQVFSFGLVLGGISIGTLSVALIGVGFVLSFVFSNYEGSIAKSILSSLTNIVSVLLGVVNVFSDIVSYIRLWAVGLAGAAISATVNELVGPLLGNFMFMILAIVLLVFGHGLNMILNVLSVIVHGIRLNTLEFSSHLDMSWSGHKFKPFQE